MRILYIGEPQTHDKYVQGIVPSHWLYGACEMEKEGHEVIWEKERFYFMNDWWLILKYRPNMVFIPNHNLHSHVLLLLLSTVKLYRKPVYAYLHHGPVVKKGIKTLFYRLLLKGLKHIFFLSEKTMRETIADGLVEIDKCSVPGWGADLAFFSKVVTSNKGYFVSTGKENRDFDILIEAFRQTGAPLIIMTAKNHNDSNYEDLDKKCKNISNVKVILTENTGDVYPQMLKVMAEAKALVCPLRQDRLNYCVGLSSISDAEGLHKPLIITHNLYHDAERSSKFHVVESVDDWVKAIQRINETDELFETAESSNSMQLAYEHMTGVMFQ